MKLRFKIFISILLVSLATLAASSYYLINRSHLDNISREQDRSINEFNFIETALISSIDFMSAGEETIKLLTSRFADSYAKRGIILMLYNNSEPVYEEFSEIKPKAYSGLLTIKEGARQAQVLSEDGRHYFFVAGNLPAQGYVLVYARNIDTLYESRTQSVLLTLVISGGLILLLSLLSYLYSRWITKPIELLNVGADAISKGDYSIRIPETKDEFSPLGLAFNKMASAVETRTRELEEHAKELQIFIDDLSHEMNTPLTSIQGYAEFLQAANASPEQKLRATAAIRQEAKRMKDIYEKLMLLTFAREHELTLSLVKVQDIFEDIKTTFSNQFLDKKVTLQIDNNLDSIRIDRTLFHMLLGNLIKNSLQASKEGDLITLRGYSDNSKAIIEVSDEGYGIPEDKLQDVFKPFYRADKSRSRKTGGAGLGLSISKSIADLHYAELKITSTLGKGTRIKIIM